MEERKHCHFHKKLWETLGWGAIIFAVLLMAGLVVSLIMMGLGSVHVPYFGILCGAFAGGAILFGIFGLFSVQRGEVWRARETDALERADGEESFFVGEDTLATFGEEGLLLHNGERSVSIPYAEMRFISVCTRRKPREKGEWSVLMEAPASYLMKKAKKGEPPVLIQAEGKERLYNTLRKHGLILLGEQRTEAEPHKFTRMRKFDLPDRAKRRRALLFLLLGAVLAGGGVGLLFYRAAIGAPVIVVGGYVVLRAVVSYQRAKRVFGVYREGLYLSELSSQDSFFLKWNEVESLAPAETEQAETLRANCLYGAYDFPRPQGAYEYIKEHFPEKCEA